MKNEADKSRMKTTGNSTERRGNTSKNSEIETYLRAHYAFRYNTVLGRTEYRSSTDASNRFTKVGRYEINSLRRELDSDVGIITSSTISIPSSKVAFRHASIPYRNTSRLCQRLMLLKYCTR